MTPRALARPGLLLAALLPGVPAAAQTPVPSPAPPVRIGLSAPLTGLDAAYGLGLRQGAEQAVADLNRAGGGRARFALATQDDGGDPKRAAAVARKFAAEGVRLVVGPLESSAVAAAAPVYEEAGAVLVTPGAAYAPLTGRGLWNLFRLGASDAQQGRAAAGYLARRFPGRRVAVVHDRTTFGRGLADAVAGRLKELGQGEAPFFGIDRGTRDLSDLVGRLKAERVEAVYFGGLAPEAAVLVRAMREAGLEATLVASDGILDPTFPAAADRAGDGVVMTVPVEGRLPEPRGAKATPRPPEAEGAAAGAYAAVEALAQAVERARADPGSVDPKVAEPKPAASKSADARAGRAVDGRRVAEALRAGQARTVLGPVGFDGRGDETGDVVALRVWRRTPDGRLDYVGNEPAAP